MRRSTLATCLFIALVWLTPRSAFADKVVSEPAADAPEAPVARAFRAALADDFGQYLEAVHPSGKSTEQEQALRERYEWSRFLKQFRWYLKSAEPVSFVVVSVRVDGDDVRRVFLRDLQHKDRMPVPVRVRRDGDTWKLGVNSL